MQREPTITEKLVNSLSYEDKLTIIKEFEQFEYQGFNDDCLLRRTARSLMDHHNMQSTSIILWMRDIAFECYRTFAKNYIDSCIGKKEG